MSELWLMRGMGAPIVPFGGDVGGEKGGEMRLTSRCLGR